MKSLRDHLIKFWLPLAIASTIVLLTVYAAVQQDMRTGANDPQVELAQDGAAALENGIAPASLIGGARVDMHASLAPFVIVYDESGNVLASSGYLNGQVPVLPKGVFDNAMNATDRITWQPASTTRIAAIVKHFGGPSASPRQAVSTSTTAASTPSGAHMSGFIAAGRNLREIESRENQLLLMVSAALVGLLVLTFIVVLYSWAVERKASESDLA